MGTAVTALLDTCAFLWLALEPTRLSAPARDIINESTTRSCLSLVSVLEIALKHRAGKLPLPLAPSEWVPSRRSFFQLEEVPLSEAVVFRVAQLDGEHEDPFDRLLAATSMELGAVIISPDRKLSELGASRLW